MQFTNSQYFNKENLKLKATRIAKYSCSGPGKFAVFIILCIIVIATFESLGLTNKERNLDSRKVDNLIKFNIRQHNEQQQERISKTELINYQNDILNEKLKIFSRKNMEEKNFEREKMLISAALDQFIYENMKTLPNEDKMNIIISTLNLEKKEEKIVTNDDDYFFGI